MHLEIRTVQKSSLPHPPTDKPRCSDGWVLSPSENRFPSMTPFLLRCKRILTWTLFHRAILYSLEADCSAYSALNPSGWRAAWIRYCERQGSLLLRMQLQRFPLGGPLKPRVNPRAYKISTMLYSVPGGQRPTASAMSLTYPANCKVLTAH